jgi:hypothetical protein
MNCRNIANERNVEMTFKISHLIFFCLALSTSAISQEKGWRGIVPLRSTRADVQKLLGHSTDQGYGATYDLGSEAVTFEYSSGPCTKRRKNGWNVPVNTVIRIRVSSSIKTRFSDVNIDKEKFEKIEDPELPDIFYYRNSEKGITYEVQDDFIITTEYGPSSKDKTLRCPG